MLDIVERSLENRATGIKDHVERSEFMPVQAERFSNPSFNAIPVHSAADGTRNGETQAHPFCFRSRQHKRAEERTGESDASIIDISELGGPQHSR